MAGCFGNHPVDRYLEGELMRHLDKESAYEEFMVMSTRDITDLDLMIHEAALNRILNRCYEREFTPSETAQIAIRWIRRKKYKTKTNRK